MSSLGNIVGIRMNLLIGPDPVPLPASAEMLEALTELEVEHSDRGPSGFSITFWVSRTGPLDLLESRLVADPRLDVDARVIVTVIFDVLPTVILDGIVTERQLRPGGEAGEGTLTLSGRDHSVSLDKKVRQRQLPAMADNEIAAFIAGGYPQYGMTPRAISPPVVDRPLPIDRTPQQRCSDWVYLQAMAGRHGYEAYVDPGPAPGTNTLYWGPPIVPGLQQRTITVNQGPTSDAFNVDVRHSAEDLTTVSGAVLDPVTGKALPVEVPLSSRTPLGLVPESARRIGRTRTRPVPTSGLSAAQAYGRALGEVDRSAADVISVTGTLRSASYNAALRARAKVDLRGVGFSFDGTYKVASVRHRIRPGEYLQDFTLTRSELGPLAPVVRPV